jgi:hypothetical protein
MRFLALLAILIAVLLPTHSLAQDSWFQSGTTITVKMHRVHHHVHRHHHRKGVIPLAGQYRRSASVSQRLQTHDTRPRSAHSPSGAAYPLVTDQLYQEFVAWCVVNAVPCFPPKGGP